MNGTHGYPRPQLERAEWFSLDGEWEFSLDPDAAWKLPGDPDWNARILVPFSPETPASGIGNTGFFRACWYRRQFDAPSLNPGDRLLLHFGAVDFGARVWVNDQHAVRHEGGYTPFCVDITDQLRAEGPQTVVVRAEDDPADLSKPRGKQDWQLRAALHLVPADHRHLADGLAGAGARDATSATLRWTPNVERWEIGFEAWLDGERRDGLRLNVKLYADDSAAGGRHVHRGRGRSAPADRAFRPGHRRLPQRAALEPGHADAHPCRTEAVATARRTGRQRAELHRAAIDRRAGRQVRAQRPALSAAHGARPGLLAGERADRAG